MSKTGAKDVKTWYYQNAGVTICRLEFEVPEIEMFGFYDLALILKGLGISTSGCYNKVVVIGMAKCNPSDIFDETIGKRIAESRAKIKMFKMLERINAKCADKFAYYQSRCVDRVYDCNDMVQTEKAHLFELTH